MACVAPLQVYCKRLHLPLPLPSASAGVCVCPLSLFAVLRCHTTTKIRRDEDFLVASTFLFCDWIDFVS